MPGSRLEGSFREACQKFATIQQAIPALAVGQPGTAGNTTVIVQTVAGSDGSFHAVVPTPPGQNILTVTVTAGGHATGWAQQTVTGN